MHQTKNLIKQKIVQLETIKMTYITATIFVWKQVKRWESWKTFTAIIFFLIHYHIRYDHKKLGRGGGVKWMNRIPRVQ